MKSLTILMILLLSGTIRAETLQGRWKLVEAVDLHADGTVASYPWGRHPVGAFVAQGGSCYLQIMSSDVPWFPPGPIGVNEQMKAALLSTYIAYSGPCVADDVAGTVVLKVQAAWRPNYVGTEQKRRYRFEDGKMLFGPAEGSIQRGDDRLTRRLTLVRP
jgi:hypothetical protein